MVSSPDKYFFINNIASVDVNDWNECAGLDHPFTRHEFLSALEKSNSASTKTGWTPFHYIEKNNKNKIMESVSIQESLIRSITASLKKGDRRTEARIKKMDDYIKSIK